MKRIYFTIAISFFTAVLFGQTFQIDIPAPEYSILKSTKNSKSAFHKEPYLLFEGINTQMRILWQLSDSYSCEIFWGTDSTYSLGNAITEEYGDDHQHSYTITGLTPGMKYHYKVEYDGDIFQASFYTAPPEDEENIKFFVYGDTRSDITNHDNNSEAMISDYMSDSDFQSLSLFTGDHVDFGAEESSWQNTFFTTNAQNIRKRMAEVPFVPCLGNHEMYDSGFIIDYSTSVFGKYFPFPFVERRYWSFDYGPMHVAILDHYPDYYQLLPLEGFLDTEQLEWLEEDLSNTNKLWKVIIIHEPGWSCEGSSSGYSHPNNPDVQNLLQPILEEYGAQIVFTAHNHYYARACKNGIYHITTAGGGAPLYEIEEEFPNVLNTYKVHHYCKVAIEGDTMTVTAVKPDGEVIDEFQLDQNNRPDHLLGFLDKEDGPGDISDVNITADGQITSPDSVGYYGMELVPGYHEASFLLSDYMPVYETIEIFEGTETQLDTMLMPSESCLPEGITFTTQAEIDDFQANHPFCSEIEGYVQIGEMAPSNITNLNGLNTITSVVGNLSIFSCNMLTNLDGLNNISFVGGDLNIGWSAWGVTQNDLLLNLTGLEGLESIGGSLVIAGNSALSDLTGLNNLQTIGGDLLIYSNDTMMSLSGLYSVNSIEGSLKIGHQAPNIIGNLNIYGNKSLVNLSGLANLQSIGQDLWLLGNTSLQNLQGLGSFDTIPGDLWIVANDSLTSFTGLENITTVGEDILTGYYYFFTEIGNLSLISLSGLENLTTVGESLDLSYNNKLADLDPLNGLISIGGNLSVNHNNLLTSLNGFQNIESSSIENLSITNNEALSTCHVLSICNYLADSIGVVGIANNAPGCNSQEEVEAACLEVSVEEFESKIEISISPNPISDNAVLSLNLSALASVEICIYNTTGICLKSLKFQNKQTGQLEFIFDLRDLSAGVYFCRAQIGNEIVTTKIIKR